MIELGILVVGAIIGFMVGGLVYRNNAEEWQAKSDKIEAEYDAAVETMKSQLKAANAFGEELIKRLEEQDALIAKSTKRKKK